MPIGRVHLFCLVACWLLLTGFASAQDFDQDGVPDASDNCPQTFNPGQGDAGGLGGPGADGTGDACECGDSSDDGLIDLRDFARLVRQQAGLSPPLAQAGLFKCQVNGDGICDAGDVTRLRQVFAGLPVVLEPSCEGAQPPGIEIDFPGQGGFTQLALLPVSGFVSNANPAHALATVNGVPAILDPNMGFSTFVPLDPNQIFHTLRAELVNPSTGFVARDVDTVVFGDAILDGDFSPMSIALRINDSGFDQLEPELGAMVPLDPNSLISPGTVLIENYCAIPLIFFCGLEVDVVATSTTIGSYSIDVDSMQDFAAGDVVVNDLFIGADVVGAGCTVDLMAETTTILGDYDLVPEAADPNSVDVNQIGAVTVQLGGFDRDFDCGFVLISLLVDLIVGNIEPQVVSGFENFLNDPDGSGPDDGPIADAIELALDAVEIAGPIGEGLGVNLQAPLFEILEDPNGITFDSDSRVTASMPDPNAPDLLASYHVDESFPSLGEATPGGLPYDVALCLSTSAFNQLLKAEVESGLLATELTEITLGIPVTITAGLLNSLIPIFGALDPLTPLKIVVRPELAPLLTGEAGPAGEIAELGVAHLVFEVRPVDPPDVLYISAAIEFSSGLDFSFDPNGTGLLPTLSEPLPGSLSIALLDNPLGADELQVQTVLGFLLPPLLPDVAGVLGAFPLPGFLGVATSGLEIARQGEFMSVYLGLSPAP